MQAQRINREKEPKVIASEIPPTQMMLDGLPRDKMDRDVLGLEFYTRVAEPWYVTFGNII